MAVLQLPTGVYTRLQALAAQECTDPASIVERWVNNSLPSMNGAIVQDPRLHGGRPIVAGTGTTVRTIVGLYKLGLLPEDITGELPLTLAQVYAALAYYHLHVDEIEADIQADSESTLMEEAGLAAKVCPDPVLPGRRFDACRDHSRLARPGY